MIKSLDFTFNKYIELCDIIKNSDYKTITFKEYFQNKNYYEDKKIILLRHDIDNKVDFKYSKEMARLEKNKNLLSTFYIRTIPEVFNKELIFYISNFGHEVGYHYEVLNEHKGDLKKAIGSFKNNLEKIRKYYPVVTISQHGGVLGNRTATTFKSIIKLGIYLIKKKKGIKVFDNKALWDKYDFRDFNIIGDAYVSLNFNDIYYFSDTGVGWSSFKNRILDNVYAEYYSKDKNLINSTDDLMNIIENEKLKKICILTHPANWRFGLIDLIKWRTLQIFRNAGKRILLK